MGLFCSAVLAVVVSCFVVLWGFFFFSYCVLVVVVAVAYGRVVVVGTMDVFLGSEICYFIVVVILFYYDIYIILLC